MFYWTKICLIRFFLWIHQSAFIFKLFFMLHLWATVEFCVQQTELALTLVWLFLYVCIVWTFPNTHKCCWCVVCHLCMWKVHMWLPLLSKSASTNCQCFSVLSPFVVKTMYPCYYCIYSWGLWYMHCLDLDAYNI